MRIFIINGPSLNLLGTRETDIYGVRSFPEFFTELQQRFAGAELRFAQSNIEGELINFIHSCRENADAIVINAAGYTHTSVALGDAIAAVGIPAVEVHISNVLAREDYRRSSFIAAKCIGSISGLGLEGYALAVQYFLNKN